MIELYNLNISDDTINEILEIFPELKEISNEDIKERVELLKRLGCNDRQITNIISSNPTYLTRDKGDISKLIKTLNNYNFSTIDILLDGNPYILNLDSYEIEDYIEERLKIGESLSDIINNLDSNPFLFSEI